MSWLPTWPFSGSRGPSPVAAAASRSASPAPSQPPASFGQTRASLETSSTPAEPSALRPAARPLSRAALPSSYAESHVSMTVNANSSADPHSVSAVVAQAWKKLDHPEGFRSQISGGVKEHFDSIKAWALDETTGDGGHGIINQGITTSTTGRRHMRITCDHHGQAKSSASASKKTGCKWVVHIQEMEEGGNQMSVVTHVKLEHNHTCKSPAVNEDPVQRFEKIQSLGQTLAELARDSPAAYEVVWPAMERVVQVAKRQKMSMRLGSATPTASGSSSTSDRQAQEAQLPDYADGNADIC